MYIEINHKDTPNILMLISADPRDDENDRNTQLGGTWDIFLLDFYNFSNSKNRKTSIYK